MGRNKDDTGICFSGDNFYKTIQIKIVKQWKWHRAEYYPSCLWSREVAVVNTSLTYLKHSTLDNWSSTPTRKISQNVLPPIPAEIRQENEAWWVTTKNPVFSSKSSRCKITSFLPCGRKSAWIGNGWQSIGPIWMSANKSRQMELGDTSVLYSFSVY